MKRIVVAVDFSNGSIHALEYAINIANKVKSEIMMIWVDKVSSPESIYAVSKQNYRPEVIKRFTELVDKYQPLCTGGKLGFKLRKGKIYYEIVTTAKTKKAELIVTGSHGVSGFEEYWIGSNANRIVASAGCPVITVRNGFDIKDNLETIVMPIDNSNHTLIKVPFTARIAKIFNATVHIYAIYSTNLKTMRRRVENFAEKAKKYLEKENVNYVMETVQTQSSTKSTIDYAKELNADLISIVTEQDERKETGLIAPCAQQLVNHSPIPVLCVHVADTIQTLKLFDQI
ncbi:MAG: universal stress protein [Bacteroidales bacterium]|jgi:nucleotide-binding universal stress UspA family protein